MSTPLCASLVRKRYDTPLLFDTPPFDPYQYEPPYGVLDGPRTGLTLQRCGSTRSLLLQPWHRFHPRALRIDLAAGFVSWVVGDAKRASLSAYLPACHLRLSWAIEPFTPPPPIKTGHLTDALIFSEADGSAGSWTVRRIPLDGVCERTADAATAFLSNGDRLLAAIRLRSGSVPDARSGALARTFGVAPPRISSVALDAVRRVRLSLHVAAHDVRWRLGAGRWHRAAGAGTRWSLPVPRSRAAHPLVVAVRFAHGGTGRFVLRVLPTAP